MFCQCLFLFFSKKFPCMIYAWNHMSMPSRASTSLLRSSSAAGILSGSHVSMPSRASTSLLRRHSYRNWLWCHCIVSMPSRASTSLLRRPYNANVHKYIGVSMPSRASTSLLPTEHDSHYELLNVGVNALTG